MTISKKLYRDTKNQLIGGVCAGVAKYFSVDVTLVRVAWLITGGLGLGVLGYIVLWFVIDAEPAKQG